ncbi:hscarg dehydrogenase [Colletotrichum musicola]|uniref:Hscarg dehydrogenase n=1 Tax=Colletotrichum musicola TaxID=2175873 RepID=A0A8H6K9V6_9PEZI|nr:hscarg dehydrogenase [Colletotrichum musicola]
MPTVCVLGATGTQGGSVVDALLKNPKWQVRGLTRNVNGAAAKRLASKGAHAVYAFTNYNWAEVFRVGRDGAGEAEQQQALNIARAAVKTPTLQHYVMSSLPPAGKVSGGKLKVPHVDYKNAAYDWIKDNLPELAQKTTQLWLGWYPSNVVFVPMMKFAPMPGSDHPYLLAQPSKPESILPSSGDVNHNTGVMVEGILEAGAKAYGKVAVLVTDYLSWAELAKLWGKVTGKTAVYAELSDEAFAKVWGVAGEEIGCQFRWSESFPSWEDVAGEIITFEELGVKEKLIGTEALLNSLKAKLI